MKKQLIALAISAATCASAQANLITNGDFEMSASSVAVGAYTVVPAGASTITGWTVTGNSVDLINAAYGAPNGVAVDLHGTPGPGQISQSFNVTAGTMYQLSFDLAGNGVGPHTMLFNFGTLSESITFSFSSVQNISRTFTAVSSGTAFVSFEPTGGDLYSGPVVDNVVVAAVPLPGSVALLGMGLLAIGARHRKQK